MKRWTIAAQKCNTSLKVALVDESLSWELLTSYCTIMLSRRKGWPLKGWNVLRANWPKFAVQVTFLDPCIDFKWGSFFVNGGWDVCYIQLLISTLCVSGCNCAALCRRPPAKNAKRCLSNVTVRCSLACVLRKHLLWQEEWRVGYNKIHGKAVMTVTYTLTCKHRKQCSGVHTCTSFSWKLVNTLICTFRGNVSCHLIFYHLQHIGHLYVLAHLLDARVAKLS